MVKVALMGKTIIRYVSPSLIAMADTIDCEIEAAELRKRGQQREEDVEAQKARKLLEQGLNRFNDQAPVAVVQGVKGVKKGKKGAAVVGVERVVDDQGVHWAKPLAALNAWDIQPEVVASNNSSSNNNKALCGNGVKVDPNEGRRLRSNTSLYRSCSNLDINNSSIINNNNRNNRTRVQAQVHASCGNLATSFRRSERLRKGSVGSLNDLSFSSASSSTQIDDAAFK
jgi:hypothetical protein